MDSKTLFFFVEPNSCWKPEINSLLDRKLNNFIALPEPHVTIFLFAGRQLYRLNILLW